MWSFNNTGLSKCAHTHGWLSINIFSDHLLQYKTYLFNLLVYYVVDKYVLKLSELYAAWFCFYPVVVRSR